MLFMSSKLNNCFYSFKSNFFHAFFAILLKVKNFGIIRAAAVLLPCSIYADPLFGGQIASEDLQGFQVAVNIPMEQNLIKAVGTSNISDVGIMFNENDFREKCSLEKGGGFIAFADIVNSKGVSIAYPSTNKRADDGETSGDKCYFVGTHLQFYLSALAGGLIGLGIGCVILQSIFWLLRKRRLHF